MNGLKRAENLAWASLGALLAIAAILVAGGLLYRFTGFWAGMMLAFGQAVAVGLAAWGLMLARQNAELSGGDSEMGGAAVAARPEMPATSFRMSTGDDAPEIRQADAGAPEVRTLDTAFQRLLVALSGLILTGLGAISAWLVYGVYRWSVENPGERVPVAGTYENVIAKLDELGLVIGLGAAAIYGVFWWLTRVQRQTEGYGEAVASGFTLGLGGMATLAVASLLGYFRVAWASEAAAGVIAALLILQGLELLVNAFRTYSSIEELDQDIVDLQSLPLEPMLGSVWLGGLRMLFAQSVGLSGRGEGNGVFARLMPRALAAMVIIAIGVSCIRVVRPGEVAILERLGYAPIDQETKRVKPEAILEPGIHFTFPWPIDDLVIVPTQQLQLTDVGKELHAPKEWKGVDFQFWAFRLASDEAGAEEDEFLTGDPGGQMLETYVQVRWRVKDPALFYNALSHSEFVERRPGAEARVVPIYEAIIRQITGFAVTQAFAIHSLDDIMINNRTEVERHCKRILQDKLDALNSGIEAVVLTIKDLHPPFWQEDREDPSLPYEIAGQRRQRGPASAYEFVVTAQQYRDMLIRQGEAQRDALIALAEGEAAATRADAQAFYHRRLAGAVGEATRLQAMLEGIPEDQRAFQIGLMEQQLGYREWLLGSDPVSKIVVDSKVAQDVGFYQQTENGLRPVQPPQ